MNATVVIAALGFASTLIGTWLAADLQRRSARASRILDAQVRIYGECAANLYEYQRAAYNRTKARLASRPEAEREELRQAAYRSNAQAKSAIGQAAFVSGKQRDLHSRLETVREAIGAFSEADTEADLRRRNDRVHAELIRVLSEARDELVR
jgi:hypothetical protein